MNINIKETIRFIRATESSLFIVTLHSIYGIGENCCGELGLGEISETKSVLKVMDNSNIKDLQCGCSHSLLLDTFGNVFATGFNFFGELGIGDTSPRNNFTKIELPFKVKKIACGDVFSVLLNQFNEVYFCGENILGQFNLPSNTKMCEFTKIEVNVGCSEKTIIINDIIPSKVDYILLCSESDLFICGIRHGTISTTDYNNNNIYKSIHSFTKTTTTKPFHYAFPLDNDIFIVTSDYEMNKEIDLIYSHHLFHSPSFHLFYLNSNEKFSDITIKVVKF